MSIQSLLKNLSLAASTVLLATQASADVVVGAHANHYGSLIIVGHPNKDIQEDTTFTLRPRTVGTDSEDGGDSNDKPLNQAITERAGEYTIIFSNSHADIEVKDGRTTTVKLQKVTASPLANTSEVSLYRKSADDSDEYQGELIGTWQRKGESREATGTNCSYGPALFPNSALDFLPIHNQCYGTYSNTPVVRPWSSAVFYVLPGVYNMTWTFEDGTTHEENNIQVN